MFHKIWKPFLAGSFVSVAVATNIYFHKKRNQSASHQKITLELSQNIIRITGELDWNTEQDIRRQLKKIPSESEIKLILTTPGGDNIVTQIIFRLLLNHPGGYIAYVKEESYSGGTIIVLGAKEIVMDNYSLLSKIDPQISADGHYTYSALDKNIIENPLGNRMKESLNLVEYHVKLTSYPNEVKNKIIEELIYSEYPHGKVYDYNECHEIGLRVRRPTNDELRFFE